MKIHRTGRKLTTEWISLKKKKSPFVLDNQRSKQTCASRRSTRTGTGAPQDLLQTVLATTLS